MPHRIKDRTPRSILLVEDNPADVGLFEIAATAAFCEVTKSVSTLSDALKVLAEFVGMFDVILLDLGLPDGRGVELVTKITRTTSVPIVVLTGSDSSNGDLAHECIKAGAQDYLIKRELAPHRLRRAIDFAVHRSGEHELERDLWERIQIDPDLFQWLESAALDGIWYLDLEDVSQQWYSEKFKSLFGYSARGIEVGSWWANNIHPDDKHRADRAMYNHIQDQTIPYDYVARYRHRRGYYIWVRCRGFTIRNEDETPIRMLGALTDVTTLKRTEITLEKRNAELERTTSILSHDLRKPIRHMVGFAEAFVEDYADTVGIDEDGLEMLEQIRKAGHKLEGLLDGITTFARLGEIREWSDVSVRAAWNDAVDDYTPDIERCSAVVEIDGELPHVYASRSMIYQVMGNLLGNSLKFARPGVPPHIVIRGAQLGARVMVEVEDNGVGIPSDMREVAFSLFRRVGPQAQFTEGDGLGLAVVARIIEAHGGKVTATESPSGGTIIRFDLPLNRPGE